ncbi:MAG TPA: LysM peptidoglycan-binding domain-containing protein [Anaerolineae bacterium]
MKSKTRIIFIVVVALLLAGALMGATPAQPAQAAATYHVVHWGETLYSIAGWYGVNVWALACANGLYNANYIYAGQVLYIPYGGSWYGGYGCMPTPPPSPYPGPYGCVYRVHWGDTLSSIAWRFHTSVGALASFNHIWNPNRIFAGQLLRVPGCYW